MEMDEGGHHWFIDLGHRFPDHNPRAICDSPALMKWPAAAREVSSIFGTMYFFKLI